MPETPSDPRAAPPPAVHASQAGEAGDPHRQLAGILARLGTVLAAQGQGAGSEAGILLAEATARVEALAARLEESALVDGLTGLPNRRYAMQRLASAWAAAVRHGRALACLVVKADGVTPGDGSSGPEAGDVVLVCVARALRKAVRGSDEVCRLDGDRFLVLCPETSLEGALAAGERLRAAAATLQVDVPGGVWKGSVSVGAAAAQEWMANSEELLQTADAGLQEARRSGNTVAAAPAVGVSRRARRAPGA